MKKNILIVLVVVNTLLIGFLLYMQFASGAKLAYVNSAYLMTNYQGFKDASVAYQQKSQVWKSNIDTLNKELQTSVQKYQAEKGKLSKKEKELSEELIQTKQNQLKQYSQGIQQKAAQEDQAMTQEVVKEINIFLKDYGEKHGYKIIFGATEAGNIVYAEEAINITEEVLEALNKNYTGE